MTVVVISPNQVKNLRSRYGSAGNKDHRFDAYVHGRHAAHRPDPAATPETGQHTDPHPESNPAGPQGPGQHSGRGRQPTARPPGQRLSRWAALFAEVDSPIRLTLLARFTHQGLADWLSPRRLEHWLAAAGYGGRTSPDNVHARHTAAPRGRVDTTAGPAPHHKRLPADTADTACTARTDHRSRAADQPAARRSVVERGINTCKQWRALATRYDKLARPTAPASSYAPSP